VCWFQTVARCAAIHGVGLSICRFSFQLGAKVLLPFCHGFTSIFLNRRIGVDLNLFYLHMAKRKGYYTKKRRGRGHSRARTLTKRGVSHTQKRRRYQRTYLPTNRKTQKNLTIAAENERKLYNKFRRTSEKALNDIKKDKGRDIKDLLIYQNKVIREFHAIMNECRRTYSIKKCLKIRKTLLPFVTIVILAVDRFKKGIPNKGFQEIMFPPVRW
jgi:hypothetical protein